jgi:predicted nucleic acid-binding protein
MMKRIMNATMVQDKVIIKVAVVREKLLLLERQHAESQQRARAVRQRLEQGRL